MKANRFCAAALAVTLLLAAGMFPFASAADAEDALVDPAAQTGQTEGEPAIVQEPAPAVCAEPEPPVIDAEAAQAADFSIQLIMQSGNGSKIRGFFPGYTADMRNIQSCYSLNGTDFFPAQDPDWVISEELLGDGIPQKMVANEDQSPLKEYLEKQTDTFYIRLQYETDAGVQVSQTAQFSRPTQTVPLPEDMTILSRYPRPMQTNHVGQYNLTVRQGATREDVLALLPQTLPVELQIFDGANNLLALASCEGKVQWNLPEPLSPDQAKVEHAVASIEMPADLEIETFDARYTMPEPIVPNMPLDLNLNWVPGDAKAAFTLHSAEEGFANYPAGMLFLDLQPKPTGAQTIMVSYSLDGGETWTQTADLLSHNEPVDAWPRNADYRYAVLFSPEQEPYRAYLAGEIDGFLVRLDITGGVLAGQSESVPWPMEYEYQPPGRDHGMNGSGGNGGNIGADNTDGSSGTNGGQRPGLPADVEDADETPLAPAPDSVISLTPLTPASKPAATPVQAEGHEPAPVSLSPELPVVTPVTVAPPAQTPAPPALLPDTSSPQPEPEPTQPPDQASVPATGQMPPQTDPDAQPDRPVLPMAAVALTLTVGGSVAICAGVSSTGAAGTGGLAKLFSAIKRLFSK